MNNLTRFYLFLLLIIIGLISFLESNQPKIIDWTPNYNVNKKSPFGMYIFDQEVDKLFKNSFVERIKITPYEYFNPHFDYDTLVENYDIRGTFLAVQNNADFDQESLQEILSFVASGNRAFLSMNTMPQVILDSLQANIYTDFSSSDTLEVSFKKNFNKKYKLPKVNQLSFFRKIDTLNTEILGYQKVKDSVKVNFIKVPYYDGEFFLHLQPAVFTNYQLLKYDNYQYTEELLSLIPNDGNIYWYSYNFAERMENQSTPMRVILSHDSLRWAWYFLLIGFLIYMIFNAKRKQRIVPIITPLSNTTVDFTKTIANLYYQEKDFKDILNKKIVFFLEKIRQEYHIDTQNLNDDFVKKLHLKSGKEKELI
ncbi:MAG: DUF4350 domain-containing protein, partial [Flavobacterium sp.]